MIPSPWSVEDQATREWMKALYRAREREGLAAARAASAASRAGIERRCGAGRSTHAFYWAAFDASGRPGHDVAAAQRVNAILQDPVPRPDCAGARSSPASRGFL